MELKRSVVEADPETLEAIHRRLEHLALQAISAANPDAIVARMSALELSGARGTAELAERVMEWSLHCTSLEPGDPSRGRG